MPVKDITFDNMDTNINWEYVMLDTLNISFGEPHEEEINNEVEQEVEQATVIKSKQKDQENEELKDIA